MRISVVRYLCTLAQIVRVWALVFLTSAVLVGTVEAGEIDPVLAEKLQDTPLMEKISIIIYLRDQVDLDRMEIDLQQMALPGDRVSPTVRYRTVLTALQDVAAQSQPAFLQRLSSFDVEGSLSDIQTFWIRNIVVVKATPQTIRQIATFPEVGTIYLDGILERDVPVFSEMGTDNPETSEPGLRVINAHRLWQLGFTGAGRLLMNIDTGVNGNNLALNTRWRGTVPGVRPTWAWHDPSGGTQFPSDGDASDNHGTHTMGTMCGLYTATGETLGVAPAARWIASNSLIGGSPHTSRSIAAFQWAANPDSNINTMDDVPDAISCSWFDPNVNTTQCEPTSGGYGPVIQAVEAMGTAVVFSAGNGGPGASTITAPKNRLRTAVDIFAVGAVDGNSPSLPIASFSSRGPSVCTGPDSLRIKPEVVAPGVSVRSAFGTSSYRVLSGTSMASPHVAGAITLLRQVAPFLTGTEIKYILLNTARDLGTTGEDNDYGKGVIDLWAAYQVLPLNMGHVKGVVTSSGNPLSGVLVDFVESIQQLSGTSDANGRYVASARIDTPLTSARYTLRAGKFGYITYTDTITVVLNDTVTRNISLTAAPGGTLLVRSLRVDSSAIRSNVRVLFGGNEVANGFTDSTTGNFSTPLPSGSYDVIVDPPSPFGTRRFNGVVVNASQTTTVVAIVRPVVEYAPSAMRDTLIVGQTNAKTLVLTNTTSDSVAWRLSTEAITFLNLTQREEEEIQRSRQQQAVEELPKGVSSTRINPPQVNGRGGPDGFGYIWIDSDEPGGPQYNWVEIRGVGTQITGLGDDTNVGPFPIGFMFPFYGNNYNQIRFCTNGFLSFSSTVTTYTNTAIPATAEPNNALYPFWDDLIFSTTNGATAWYFYDAANQRFIVQYDSVPHFGTTEPGRYTFQVILKPSGEMLYQYRRMEGTLNSATIGIENQGGTIGLQVVFNASYMHDNLAILFKLRGVDWLSYAPSGGILLPSAMQNVTATFNAMGLTPGTTYQASTFLDATHPDVQGSIVIPTSLRVQPADSALLVTSRDSVTFPTIPVNATRRDSLIAYNAGLMTLNISSLTTTNPRFVVSPTSAILATGESIYVRVSYTPTAEGTDTGRVIILSNSQGQPRKDIGLRGSAIGVPHFTARRSGVPMDSLVKVMYGGSRDSILFHVVNDGTGLANYSASAVMFPRTAPAGAEVKPTEVPMVVRKVEDGHSSLSTGGVPELMYYKFNESGGSSTRNFASPGVGTNPAPVLGLTMGSSGQFGTALIGNGGASGTNYVNTGWTTALGSGSWTISMWLNNVPSNTTLYYLFGDNTASSFRSFLGGAAGAGNVTLRVTGLSDLIITGVAPGPTVVTYVYDASASQVRAYRNGVQVASASATLNINGTGVTPFKVGGYSTSTSIPPAGLMDEFRLYNRALTAQEIAATWNRELGAGNWLAIAPTSGTLSVGDSVLMSARFDASDSSIYNNPGNYFGRVDVRATNAPLADTLKIPVRMFVQPPDTGILVVEPDSLNFGGVRIGSSRMLSFRVRNIGGRTVNVTNINITNTNFTADPTSFSVPSLDTFRVNVTFNAPSPPAQYSGVLSFVSNAASAQTVRLAGTSVGVPDFRVRVDSLTRTLQGGTRDSILFYMRNTGTGSGNFAARAIMYPRTVDSNGPREPIVMALEIAPAEPPATNSYTREQVLAMVGRAPSRAQQVDGGDEGMTSPGLDHLVGERAFGYEYFGAQFVKFNLSTPGTLVPLGSFTTSDNIFAGDFTNDASTILAIKGATNQLIRVDTTNGSYTAIGPVTIQSGHTWTSMKFDINGTLYATSTSGTISTLYTINPSNGNTTVVGTITNIPIIIGMAIHPSTGQMYGYDIESGGTQQSRFFSINKNTAAGTLIGPTGFIGRFAQDMDFDPQSGVLYMAAYNFGRTPATGELRTVNLATGGTTLVGDLGVPQREVDFFTIKGVVGATGDWFSVAPGTGTVAVNDSVLMKAYFDARDPLIYNNPGNYLGRLEVTATNSPLADTLRVPARLFVVPPPGARLVIVGPDSVDFGNVEIGRTDSSKSVLVKNIGQQTLNVTNITISNPAFSVDRTSFSLVSLDTTRLRLRFTAPSPGGVRTAVMNFVSNDPQAPSVRLRGNSIGVARIAVQPDSFYFSRPASGDTTRTTFRIRNTGTDTLRYNIDELPSLGLESVVRSMEQQTVPEPIKGSTDGPGNPPQVNGRGGPDAFGYIWIDSDEPGGPTYNFVDIRGVGTQITGLGDDTNVGPFPIGFTFPFYGNNYTQFRLCTNGFLSFTSTVTTYTNTAIPTTAEPNNALYPFWDDLNFAIGVGTAWYRYDAANQRLIIQYDSVSFYSGPGTNTFQVILKPNGDMLFQYRRMTGAVNSATIGIENQPGTIGLQVVFDAPYLHDNMAILFTRDAVSWMSVNRTSGVIAPGDSQAVELRIHPAGMAGGTYTGRQRVSGNTPDVRDVRVRLDVVVAVQEAGLGIPTEFALNQNYPNPFNPVTTIKYALPVDANVTLTVFNILGQQVATLVHETQKAAFYDVQWNGHNKNGAAVASGIYFFRIDAAPVNGDKPFSQIKKMIMLK